MLVRLFKSNHPLAYFIIPGLALLLRIPAFFIQDEFPNTFHSLIFFGTFTWINEYTWLSILLAVLFTTISAIYLNSISDKYGLLQRVSFLGGLAFVLLTSILPNMSYFSPIYPATLILLFVYDQALALYQDGNGLSNLFNASLALGIASLFVPTVIYLLVFIALGFLYFKTVHPRFFSVLLAGFLIPWLYWFTVKLWYNELDDFYLNLEGVFNYWEGFSIHEMWNSFIPFLLVFVLAVRSFMKGISSNTVRIRKSYILILWSLLLIINSILQFTNFESAPWMLLAIPLSFILSNSLYYNKRGWLSELLVFSIILWEIAAYWIL